MTHPVITLTNGVRVANFSSPHAFQFVDGSVLPACSAEWAQATKLEAVERQVANPYAKHVIDIELSWRITETVYEALQRLNLRDDIDIVLVPFPVMTALKEFLVERFGVDAPDVGKARVIRVADRVSKEIHIDRFCR